MTPSNTASGVTSIREQVAGTREALLGSGDLIWQILALEVAVAQLRQLEAGGVPLDEGGELAEEMELLRSDIARVGALVRHGEEFWRGWARLMGMDTGYTPAGVLAPVVETSSRFSVEG